MDEVIYDYVEHDARVWLTRRWNESLLISFAFSTHSLGHFLDPRLVVHRTSFAGLFKKTATMDCRQMRRLALCCVFSENNWKSDKHVSTGSMFANSTSPKLILHVQRLRIQYGAPQSIASCGSRVDGHAEAMARVGLSVIVELSREFLISQYETLNLAEKRN